jgi:hypothetical protein
LVSFGSLAISHIAKNFFQNLPTGLDTAGSLADSDCVVATVRLMAANFFGVSEMIAGNVKLGTWTHPTTGQVRIYINSPRLNRGVKLFAVEATDNPLGMDIQNRGCQTMIDRQDCEAVSQQVLQACGFDWSKLVEMAG